MWIITMLPIEVNDLSWAQSAGMLIGRRKLGIEMEK